MEYLELILYSLLAIILVAVFLIGRKGSAIKDESKATLEEPISCSLCGVGKHEENILVQGLAGAVCSNCVPSVVQALDKEFDENAKSLSMSDQIIARVHDNGDQGDNADNYLKFYLLALCEENEDTSNHLISLFANLKNFSMVRNILKQKARQAWSHEDIINWQWANCNLGLYQEALDFRGVTVSEDLLNDEYKRLFTLNTAACEIGLDRGRENLSKQLNKLLQVEQFFNSNDYPIATDHGRIMPSLLTLIAQVYVLLEDSDNARRYLEERDRIENPDEHSLMTHGNLLELEGNLDLAREAWKASLGYENRSVDAREIAKKLQKQ